ncbi:MAG: SusC/RagA family TonB-linked outer membrane protein [Gemmatimonadaceae bacterium]|nr:SusC/RagA family TonB-linked outer membrane protein [Gemmatimonadaceae bacterium]
MSFTKGHHQAPWLARIAGTLAVVLTAGLASVAQAQTGTLAGRVTDAAADAPLPGVTLQVEGTRFGAGTANDGRYRITGLQPGSYVIIARRLGYNPQRQTVTVSAGSEATANFRLQASAIALDQVVVTGTAGAQEKRSIGNAVTTISASEELAKSAAPNLGALLNARATGVTILPRSGRLGAGPSIQIRGRASLSLENSPLLYIDGVRVNNSTATGPVGVSGGLGGQGSQFGGRLNDLNPEDIESIEIIKGPAAGTIYGTEAANGVIQVITKRGAANSAPQVAMGVEVGSLSFYDAVNRINTNYAKNASGTVIPWNGLQQEIDSGRGFYKTGQTRRYNGSVSGGRDLFRYYVGGSYQNDLGIEPNNTLQQMSFRANVSAAVRPSTDVTASLGSVILRNRLGADYGASPLLGAQVGHSLLFPATRGFFAVSPEIPQRLYDNKSNVNRFTGSVQVTNRPTSWFTHRAILGVDQSAEDARALERFAPPDLAKVMSPAAAGGRVGQTIRNNTLFTAEYGGTAKAKLGSAIVSTSSVGGQFYRTELNTSFLGGFGFAGPGLELVSAAATQVAATQTQVLNTTIGAYGEQQFAWRDRLYVTAALRVDNNSAFGADFKWVTYPKVSASWVVNEEEFWTLDNTIQTFRLRVAYGASGRQPNAFAALRTFTPVTGPGGGTAVTPGSLGNPDLKPEVGKELELGFEAGLFNRLSIDFTYFTKSTKDVIVSQAVAPSAGFPGQQFRNLGEVSNSGIEISSTLQALQRRNVSWEVTGKVSTNKDRIEDLGGLPSVIATAGAANIVGYPIGGIFVRRIASADRDATGAATNILCQAANGGTPIACATAPFLYIGTPTPKLTGAVSNTVTIGRNLRLYALMDFRNGNRLYNAVELLRCGAQLGVALCDVAYNPSKYDIKYVAQARGQAVSLGTTETYFQDASFVKLREVSATYTLPERWFRKRASVTLAGRELKTWTDYRGIDPESNVNNAATTAQTIDQASTPNLMRFIATFNISW